MKFKNATYNKKDKRGIISKIITFGMLIVVLTGIFATPSHTLYAVGNCPGNQIEKSVTTATGFAVQCVDPGTSGAGQSTNTVAEGYSAAGWMFEQLAKGIGYLLMTISGLILTLAGKLFDIILQSTIVDMAKNLGDTSGIGGSITIAWATLRDVANIAFIFVLLYAAFKAMFDTNFGNFQTTVKNIIIVALLINFSLFFSKVVIDASNVVAIGFYNSITSTSSLTVDASGGTAKTNFTGISAGYMNMLGLQSWYSPNILTNNSMGGTQILVVGIMGAVFMLIASVILLISGMMFLARFVILIFIMILSPLALIAYIIPGQKNMFDKWLSALIDQSFFAPIFFALTWVVFKIGSNPNFLGALRPAAGTAYTDVVTKLDASAASLVLNYVLIIGFSIAALIVSKTMATKTAGFKTISGGIGTVAVGGAAWAGRTTIGRTGKYISERAGLQDAAKNKTGFAGAGARLALYASQKARSGTFDVRNAAIPTSVVGDTIQGTVGRTKVGKKLGLNDVAVPSIAVSSIVKDMDMLGKGGTKGFKERKEESNKRVNEREAAQTGELTIAQTKKDVRNGISAAVGSPEYDAMEKALAKISDKETETLVANNRELLSSLNFANAISVKQLETLNKSEQLSGTEKATLKTLRFRDINTGVSAGATVAQKDIMERELSNMSDKEIEILAGSNKTLLENKNFTDTISVKHLEAINKSEQFSESEKTKLKNTRFTDINTAMTTGTPAAITAVKGKIKGLSDSELEMIDASYLRDPNFVSELRPAQVESINKSSKFTSSQKQALKEGRNKPLVDALTANNVNAIQSLIRKVDYKTMVSYMNIPGRGGVNIALDPAVLPTYNPKILTRMADEMNDADKLTLKAAIIAGGHPDTKTWLNDPNKGGSLFI